MSIAIVNNILSNQDDDLTTSSQRKVRDAGYRVLVIDDNEAAAQTIGWLVNQMAAKPSVLITARMLCLAGEYKPDFVFLDIGIPGMDGYEICHLMKALPWGWKIPSSWPRRAGATRPLSSVHVTPGSIIIWSSR